LAGFVVYRFRQTRSMTFHQFFEARYSRGVRVLASFLNVFSACSVSGLRRRHARGSSSASWACRSM